MKILVQIAAVLLLLALDWAALHDIVRGREPSYISEYTILLASVLIFGAMIVAALRGKRKSQLTGG